MLGSTFAQCSLANDEFGVEGLFFVADTLAIRNTGLYILQFDLFEISFTSNGRTKMATVYSDKFEAFAPQSYPGIVGTVYH
jgi:hypothetical protein